MAVTRSITRKQNQGACSKKRAKTLDNDVSPPWSYLIDEVLFLIMLKLGVVDFVAFSGVCKRWRSVALSNRNMFIASRQPLSLSFSNVAYKKHCHLEDLQGRTFKTNLPHSTGRTCVGSTCGYLIFYGTSAYDFWLVNLITRHELHFPRYPLDLNTVSANVKGILVFSPSMSGWVFVISQRLSSTISFCLAGKEDRWNHLSSKFPIHDIHFFQGKIYSLTAGSRLQEVRLNPKPGLKPPGTNILKSDLALTELTSWGENLYVMGCISEDVYEAMEVDFDKTKKACPDKTMEKYVCFVSILKSGDVGKVGIWDEPHELYAKFGYFHDDKSNHLKGKCFTADMWYFPHDCLIVNRLHE